MVITIPRYVANVIDNEKLFIIYVNENILNKVSVTYIVISKRKFLRR